MQKILKPTAREKKRYLIIKGSKKEAEKAILDYIGVLGYAKAAPVWVKNNILAINRKELDRVRASFAISEDIIQIQKVSGTLKGLRK